MDQAINYQSQKKFLSFTPPPLFFDSFLQGSCLCVRGGGGGGRGGGGGGGGGGGDETLSYPKKTC